MGAKVAPDRGIAKSHGRPVELEKGMALEVGDGRGGGSPEVIVERIHNLEIDDERLADPKLGICDHDDVRDRIVTTSRFLSASGEGKAESCEERRLFQEADQGTAFLDEIGELSPIIQTKLLRVLQEREIKPVGGTKNLPIDVRIIAATNKILEDEIKNGNFREDLFYRLAVVPIRVPALRERKSDIPRLVNHFLFKYSRVLGKEVREISSYALEVLMSYDFPGNVRELENIIERGVALESSNIILPENLSLSNALGKTKPTDSGENSPFLAVSNEQELFDRGLDDVIETIEKRLISHALNKTGNSKTKAAELLRVSFRSLRYKVKKYEL